jgi:hypothetical protein
MSSLPALDAAHCANNFKQQARRFFVAHLLFVAIGNGSDTTSFSTVSNTY